MKNAKALKSVWWAILLIDLSYFLVLRYSALVSGNGTFFDAVVFVSWLGLCLIPIFSNAVSLSLKSEQKSTEPAKNVSSAKV
jgi:hypothetical protein